MPAVLIVADTARSPELRHELPVFIADPCIYIEAGGERHLFIAPMELTRVQGLGLVLHSADDLGSDDVLEQSATFHEYDREMALRACRSLGVTEAVAPPAFPLGIAEHLRAGGVLVECDDKLFADRRRVKNEAELAGIRRSLRATEQAMTAIRERLRTAAAVTSEDLRDAVRRSFTTSGVIPTDDIIVSHGPQTAIAHEAGHGPISPGEPIVADLFPRDPESGCYSDMTRTFCVGVPPAELVEYQRLCREALDLVVGRIRPGISGAELHRLSCEPFAAAGHPTALSKAPGATLDEGFFHSLGHGVGLEVHEAPFLGRGGQPLVAGDVVAIEPGCYRPGFGGCRLEDLVLVTGDGCEVLTDYPYDLAP